MTEGEQAQEGVGTALARTAVDPAGALGPLADQAAAYITASRTDATRRAYRSAWRIFRYWCREHHFEPLPASVETVRLYLTWRAERTTYRTLRRDAAALSTFHRLAGHASPTRNVVITSLLRGIRNVKGDNPTKKRALLAAQVAEVVAKLPATLAGARDRALLLLGFGGALRRSELVGLEVRDLIFDEEGRGVTLNLRWTKTDLARQGEWVGVPHLPTAATCPVCVLQAWLQAAGITQGPIFRPVDRFGRIGAKALTSESVAEIVKRSVVTIGLNPAEFAGHSLRSGFATSAGRAGAQLYDIMAHTRHRTVRTAREYIQRDQALTNNLLPKLGL